MFLHETNSWCQNSQKVLPCRFFGSRCPLRPNRLIYSPTIKLQEAIVLSTDGCSVKRPWVQHVQGTTSGQATSTTCSGHWTLDLFNFRRTFSGGWFCYEPCLWSNFSVNCHERHSRNRNGRPRCYVFIINFIFRTWQASVGGVSGVCQIARTVMMQEQIRDVQSEQTLQKKGCWFRHWFHIWTFVLAPFSQQYNTISKIATFQLASLKNHRFFDIGSVNNHILMCDTFNTLTPKGPYVPRVTKPILGSVTWPHFIFRCFETSCEDAFHNKLCVSTDFIIFGPIDQKLWVFKVIRRSLGKVGMCWSQWGGVDQSAKKEKWKR